MIKKIFSTDSKAFIVFLFSIIALIIFALSTQLSIFLFPQRDGILYAIFMMVIAIPFHIKAKKIPILYILSFALNSIACGCSVSVYYLAKNIELNLLTITLSIILGIAILFFIFFFLSLFPKTKTLFISIGTIFTFILLGIAVFFWIKTSFAVFSFSFFSLLIVLFYICAFGVTINHSERAVLGDISLGSFGCFIILTVVVIMILSEGDFIDIGDFGWGSSKKGKYKKPK